MTAECDLVAEAMRALGKRSLVIGVQDPSFPGKSPEDIGRGTPYSDAADAFLRFVSELGFSGVQLGPQGMVSKANPSPYDGTLFSRNTLNLHLPSLHARGLLSEQTLARWVEARPEGALLRADHSQAWRCQSEILEEVHLAAVGDADLQRELLAYCERSAEWLLPDALYEALCLEHGADYAPHWRGPDAAADRMLWNDPGRDQRIGELRARHDRTMARFALGQLLLEQQHAAFRARVRTHALLLYGDFQTGMSPRDEWASRALMLDGYRMGAPPSRTNPLGQPWGYGVLNPELFGDAVEPGPAAIFMARRLQKLLREVDGIRLDHPHGLATPWIYRVDEADPFYAVQNGARLNCSPDLPDHPRLAALSLVRSDQLDRSVARHADGWVHSLDEEQVTRFGVLFEMVIGCLREHGFGADEVVCEVLSTLPYPLQRVLERHGLGRFRVLQKASLEDPNDVYRSENARPQDWVMLGNHDTPPIWSLLGEWAASGRTQAQARDLAARLQPDASLRPAYAARLCARPGLLAQAMLADAFASPARHVYVFFPDLLGMDATFNRPGSVGPENWALRVPPDFAALYAERRSRCAALHLPYALALALESQLSWREAHKDLISALRALAPTE